MFVLSDPVSLCLCLLSSVLALIASSDDSSQLSHKKGYMNAFESGERLLDCFWNWRKTTWLVLKVEKDCCFFFKKGERLLDCFWKWRMFTCRVKCMSVHFTHTLQRNGIFISEGFLYVYGTPFDFTVNVYKCTYYSNFF